MVWFPDVGRGAAAPRVLTVDVDVTAIPLRVCRRIARHLRQ